MRRLAAQRLLPAEGADIDPLPVDVLGERRRGRVANGEAGAVGRNPVRIMHSDTARRAVPREDDVARGIDAREVGDLAIIGGADVGVELELLRDVGHPAGPEALPRQHRHRPRAQQRPDRHLHRAGVGGRDDAEPVIGGELQQRMGAVDSIGKLRLADRAAVRASERRGVELVRAPAGRLRARARGKIRAVGFGLGFRQTHFGCGGSHLRQCDFPSRELAPRWDGVARRQV